MPAATVLSSVSTTAVDAPDRLAFWEHYNAEALVGLTCSTYAMEGLVARQLNLDLGGFRVADIAGNRHVIERAPALVRARPKDATFVTLLLEGEAFFYHADGCLTLGAGDVIVYETDRPYLFGFGSAMRQLLVDVPRPLFLEWCGPGIDRPLTVPGDGPGPASLTARALRETLLGLVDDPAVSPDTVRDQLLDLLQTMTTGRGTPSGTSRLLAAKAHIAEHLAEPSLCADSVARAVGVTPRHLNRAFATEGTTVAQYVQGRRLDSARVDLTASSTAHYRIADIACRWGFASQAHFTRLFRARFGCTPSDVRRGAAERG
ncbi:helix-turn-helix domain-containing protein [Pseudonocardia kunmingensis]|uniref:AraC-like DNA-binding protein n=1 Tax=Pseudonocardia kunmingensis TaxID=630975 RepID=A0A543DQW9_9PSEU|nr:helix-turn-helix domain-containing protein [Pseudonocardia kunmingensis]TQM11727.1 AraC-like DNA-binding protein [Pseudonocardia kunmingensis]